MWSIGCVFAELLQMQKKNCVDHTERTALFPGVTCFPFSASDPQSFKSRTDQLGVIFDQIGTPSDEEINNIKDDTIKQHLKSIKKKRPRKAKNFYPLFPDTSKEGVKLLLNMIKFDPNKRITIENALSSEYFNKVRNIDAEKYANYQKRYKQDPVLCEFEDININIGSLRLLIIDEVMFFNPTWTKQLKSLKKKMKKMYNKPLPSQ